MPRVMLVDDDHDTVYSFQVVLELNGYDVDGFTDPYSALRNFSEGLYDLIVVGVKCLI
jgi:DNA-binding response OmpR family regulator